MCVSKLSFHNKFIQTSQLYSSTTAAAVPGAVDPDPAIPGVLDPVPAVP